jgi:hypothetical protein
VVEEFSVIINNKKRMEFEMNPYTMEVKAVGDNLSQEETQQLKNDGFVRLPKSMERAAKLKLNGNQSAIVSRTSGGKLSRHAAKLRKHNERFSRSYNKRMGV